MNSNEAEPIEIQVPRLFQAPLIPFNFVAWKLTDAALPLIFINGDPEKAGHCYIGKKISPILGSLIKVELYNYNNPTVVATAFIGDFPLLINPTLSKKPSPGDVFRFNNLQYKVYLYPKLELE